jgi:hypothetical protein
MEKIVNKKIESYLTAFKDNIRNKITELNIPGDVSNKLIQYVYDYERLTFQKEDLTKRKRVKNIVPNFDRCCAKRANGEQCTRRKKEECEYCGTHQKSKPHGIIDMQNSEEVKTSIHKVEVWAQDIHGIVYYIDNIKNVYQTEDIISNKPNPKVIASYIKNGENYSIPSFGI